MATLEKIRSKAALLVIVVGIALFAFIIGDFLRSESTFFQQNRENIAVVNGEGIHYQDFHVKVEERINGYKRNTGRTMSEDENHNIRQTVLNDLINEILLKEQTGKLGLVVGKEETRDIILGDNTSPVLLQMLADPQTGAFDKNALLQFLREIENDNFEMLTEEQIAEVLERKSQWLSIENIIIQSQLSEKYVNLLASAVLTNELEAQAAFEDKKISVDFNYVAQSINTVPDNEVEVSDSEIQKRYNETKEQYEQEEVKVINFIAVNIAPGDADLQAAESKLNELKEPFSTSGAVAEIVQNNSDVPYIDAYVSFNSLTPTLQNFVGSNPIGSTEGPIRMGNNYHLYKFEGETVAPDSVKINLLELPMSFDDVTFNHLTDSLIQVLKDGTSFADMAIAASGGQTNGDLGWGTETDFVQVFGVDFKNRIFGAKINEPFVVQAAMGNKFLMQVTEKTQPIKKYKVANIEIHVTPGRETKTKLYNDLSQFMVANHSLEAMKEKAYESGYTIRTDVEVAKEQAGLDGIQGSRSIIQWAFNNKNGAISDITECQNGEYFVVAAVQDHLSEGYRPLALVSDILKRQIINEKKAEKIVSDLKSKKLTSLEQYSEAMNVPIQDVKFVTFATPNIAGIGQEPILNAKAPKAPTGEVAGPYIGQNKVYVIYVVNKKVDENKYDATTQMAQLRVQNISRVNNIFRFSNEFLRNNAKIEDNFNRFF
ncbi:MAG: SurA N-terminal domain-containing protein [Dysgonamonadaceae bacterium]|jgi:peptidyl-prolyl cis-trans isomerase D|nr:SurA N-terminal domain-containing protein [Dysgonamonadaceae bacterium]